MSDDLIERLRVDADRWMSGDFGRDNEEAGMLSHEAADEITRLRAELSSLRNEGEDDAIAGLVGAVRAFMPTNIGYGNQSIPDDLILPLDVTMGELRAIRQALALCVA